MAVENSPNSPECLDEAVETRKKVLYCFYKIFLEDNLTNEGKCCLFFTAWPWAEARFLLCTLFIFNHEAMGRAQFLLCMLLLLLLLLLFFFFFVLLVS